MELRQRKSGGSGMLSSIKNFDMYPKTMDDFKEKTVTGATVSIVSTVFIVLLFLSELNLYLTPETVEHLTVDSRVGQRLRIHIDVTFPSLPCSIVSLDAMDASGDQQIDVLHDVIKSRLDHHKREVGDFQKENVASTEEKQVLDYFSLPDDYCGSCYGASKNESDCCNTCKQLKQVYEDAGMDPKDADYTEQCSREKYMVKRTSEKSEGCRLSGFIEVQKVAGNFHFAPGKSFEHANKHVHELNPAEAVKYNVSHVINSISFGEHYPGVVNPLDGLNQGLEKGSGVFQYFIKVVPTTYRNRWGRVIETNQYSVTDHKRAIDYANHFEIPGVFFIYDISPIKVEVSHAGKSFLHFLTNCCAIIGGVFTVAGIIDSFLYHGSRAVRRKMDVGKLG